MGVLGDSTWSLWMDLGRGFFCLAAGARGLSTVSMSSMSFSCLRRRYSCRMNSLRARSSSFLWRSSSVFRLRDRSVRLRSAPAGRSPSGARAGRGRGHHISAPWGRQFRSLKSAQVYHQPVCVCTRAHACVKSVKFLWFLENLTLKWPQT